GAGLSWVASRASALAALSSMRRHGEPREPSEASPPSGRTKPFDRRENMACCKPKSAGSDAT
ncbi:hypothetical protein V6C16_05585, partial [Desulfovibrio sp. 1188_IL3213]|uniref:hypothetical protein n=1 Tax=Desulfovibrio sp. 1188_IL3213 TaxID=3084052 RepID=UPI002FD980DE